MIVPCPACQKKNRIRIFASGEPVCGGCKRTLPRPATVVLIRRMAAARPPRPRTLAVAAGVSVLLLLSAFVWPTRWRYEDYHGIPTRTNRFTSEVQVLNLQYGWIPR